MTELLAGCVGKLLKMVRERKVKITWNICVQIAIDAAESCNYLHTLKPQILVHKTILFIAVLHMI